MSAPHTVRALLIATPFLLAMAAAGTLVSAQRGANPPSRATPPAGAEIAAAARAGKLDMGNVGTATMFGKPFKFTPVRVATENDTGDPTKGLFAGVLENGAPGDETGLPAGKYNLFVANVTGQWKCYAEANGQVVREAIRTTVTPAPAGANAPPRFTEKGWCMGYYQCWNLIKLDGVTVTCQRRTVCF